MGRDQIGISKKTLFPQTEDGHCAVCKEEITEKRRRRYCGDRCSNVAKATMYFWQWNTVRRFVLNRDEWTCQICGESKKEKIAKYREEYPGRVKKWGDPKMEHKFEVDHVKPVSKGGAMFDPENLQTTCQSCNREKSDKYRDEPHIFDFYDQAAKEE